MNNEFIEVITDKDGIYFKEIMSRNKWFDLLEKNKIKNKKAYQLGFSQFITQ